jgi:Fic family protein
MELLQMKELANNLAEETYEEITVTEQVRFAWEISITASEQPFGTLFRQVVIEGLKEEFMNGLKKMAERATVSFGEVKKPTEMVLPPPPPEKITSFEEVIEDDEVGTDALGLPKGVKRIH